MDQYLIQEYASSESASNQQVSITLKQIAQSTHQQILHIIYQKDITIQNFSHQITRLKAEDIKSKKLISSLQQKIQKHLASGTNTSSTFMIASEFKSLLTTFMTNTIPGVFYDFVDHPIIYAKLVKKIMVQVYTKIQKILQGKLKQICNLLTQKCNSISNTTETQRKQQQLRLCLLNYFQNNFKEIFLCKLNQDKHQSNTSLVSINLLIDEAIDDVDDDELNDKIATLNSQQVQCSEEMNQFCQQLYQICIYMILQESKWEFVFDHEKDEVQSINLKENNKEKIIFNKKDFTCIDGFTKEGKEVCYVLKALRKKDHSDKQFYYHPNIKNFVLPVNDNYLSNRSFDLEVNINFLESQISQQPTQNNQVIKQKISKLFENQSIQTNENILTDRMIQTSQNILKNHEGLEIQGLSETQNSQIIDFYQEKIEPKMKQALQQNCIVNPICNFEIKKNEADKENINLNCESYINKSKAHQGESHTKKQKQLNNEKNSKKSKKQKNNSTIDLTNQKRKLSQKESHIQREAFDDLSNNMNSAKNYELPLGNVKGSHKKKGVSSSNKAGRKCSVGKIISQSIHINGCPRTINRQKVSLSQHSTILMKQPCTMRPAMIKDNNFFIINQLPDSKNHQNKQNMFHFGSNIYQKHVTRPKRSVKLCGKNVEQKLFSLNSNFITASNNHNAQKQDRPLIVHKSSNNGINIGRLRQKYLVN